MKREIKSSNHIISLENCSQYATILWCISIGWSVGIANVLMVITSILIFINFLVKRPTISFKNICSHPIILLFLLLLLSVIWSKDITAGFLKMKTFLPLLLFPLVLLYWNKVQPQIILKGVKYLSFSLVFGLIITYTLNILPTETALNIVQKFGNILKAFPDSDKDLFGWYVPFMIRINYCNILSYTGIAIIFLYIVERKPYYLLMSLFFLSSSFVMGARASMIAVMVIVPFIILLNSKNIFQKISLSKIFIFIGLLIGTIYFIKPNIENRIKQTKYEIESIQDQTFLKKDYQNFTTLLRMYSWKNAIQVVKIEPVLGQGIGDYKKVFEEQYQQDKLSVPLYYHSQWLYFIGVFGVLGIIIFIISYLYFGLNFKRSPALYYLIIFSLYTSIVWIFDTLLLQKIEMMAFALFLSFATCLKKTETSYI
jgi:hypothetical protein